MVVVVVRQARLQVAMVAVELVLVILELREMELLTQAVAVEVLGLDKPLEVAAQVSLSSVFQKPVLQHSQAV